MHLQSMQRVRLEAAEALEKALQALQVQKALQVRACMYVEVVVRGRA